MLYLLWGLLNIGLFLFFILICFKATKLITEKLGLFASLVFVFGLLSFIGHSNNDNENIEPNTNKIKTWKFVSEDSLENIQSDILKIDLENKLVLKYDLSIKYGIDRQRKNNIPISAYSSTTGFISGTNWKPIDITVIKTEDKNKFEYCVYGTVEWKLLGATIYFEPKAYKGIAKTK